MLKAKHYVFDESQEKIVKTVFGFEEAMEAATALHAATGAEHTVLRPMYWVITKASGAAMTIEEM